MDSDDINMTDLNDTMYEDSGYSDNSYIHFTIASVVAIAIALFGMVGNVIIFWYLLFKIKRNKYTVYIINLAVADFIFLIFSAIILMLNISTLLGENSEFARKDDIYLFLEICYDSSQYSGMFFLTAISMERCLSVIFPMWYQCYRPNNLSTIVCFLLWIIGCLQSFIENFVCQQEDFTAQTTKCTGVQLMTFIIGIGICLPLMIFCSLTLLIVIKKTFRQQYPQKLYIIIIIAVFIFVMSVSTFNFVWFLMYFQLLSLDIQYVSVFYASTFGTVLNSTINPYMYYFVGRQWKQRSHHSIQDALQRAFKADEGDEEDKEKSHSEKTNSSSEKTNSSSCVTNISQESLT
ncbi:mas-related G-protein coupled receptor member H-like [Pelodytes ibericus]